MIKAEEAIALADTQGRISSEKELPILSQRGEKQLLYLDALVEGAIYKYYTKGTTFSYKLPIYAVELPVIDHLKRVYEKGGWIVTIFPISMVLPSGLEEAQEVRELLLTFSPSQISTPAVLVEEWPPKELPNVVSSSQLTTAGGRLLIRMPTRDRPTQALAVLQKYREMAGVPVQIEVVVDEDDSKMLSAEVMQRLAALQCTLTVGNHKSKIEACNGGRVNDWDVIVLASDDQIPVVNNYGAKILTAMQERWPYFDGALHFNDGKQGKELCTLPVLGRRLYNQFGYVYAPEYKSLFCDREQTDVLQAMGRLSYIDEVLIEHRHPVWGRVENDPLYERNNTFLAGDRLIYEQRKLFATPQLLLSILICSVPERRAQLDWLVNYLYAQIIPTYSLKVEIVIDDRGLPTTVGEKRQTLLGRARGRYVAFIDDDDGVAFNYVERILMACAEDKDCCSLTGIMTENGKHPRRFDHSLTNSGWFTREDGSFARTPNHISAIRRDLALKAGFLPKNIGEDHAFSNALLPMLKTEASTGDAPLYFYWSSTTQSVQAT